VYSDDSMVYVPSCRISLGVYGRPKIRTLLFRGWPSLVSRNDGYVHVLWRRSAVNACVYDPRRAEHAHRSSVLALPRPTVDGTSRICRPALISGSNELDSAFATMGRAAYYQKLKARGSRSQACGSFRAPATGRRRDVCRGHMPDALPRPPSPVLHDFAASLLKPGRHHQCACVSLPSCGADSGGAISGTDRCRSPLVPHRNNAWAN